MGSSEKFVALPRQTGKTRDIRTESRRGGEHLVINADSYSYWRERYLGSKEEAQVYFLPQAQ